MYQFYYSDGKKIKDAPVYKKNVADEFDVSAVRPTMWEEHCLECSAPVCFGNCVHYVPRSDGRCMRFENGIFVYPNEKGCCGQGARVKFRKWANMMTIIFPTMLKKDDYSNLTEKNQKLGNKLKKVAGSKLPLKIRWEYIRTVEYLRRRKLRKANASSEKPDAFLFHGYSFEKNDFNLIIEIYKEHTSVYKTSLQLSHGENLITIDSSNLPDVCSEPNNLVKVYPENDLEAEIDILWCDFVNGKRVTKSEPGKKVKCVVWDLDNTLWDGILIETDDPDSLKLRPGVLNTIEELDKHGFIQSIASKNDHDAAWAVIERLGISEYFLYPEIHWNAKSASLEQIAKDLNIGIESLALIDDSPFERNQVKSFLPAVRVYDETEITKLLDKPEFDVLVTNESRGRRLMYKAEEKRNKLLHSSDNLSTVEFLRKCNLKIELFEPAAEDELLRSYELVVRTNQLNLSGIKYDEKQFEEVLHRPDHTSFAFTCSDDFGSYGIVCFGQYKIEDSKLVFTEFAMSCRIAGKYVESALFSALLEKENCEEGVFRVIKTKKNVLLRNTLTGIGFKTALETDDRVTFTFTKELENKDIASVQWRG